MSDRGSSEPTIVETLLAIESRWPPALNQAGVGLDYKPDLVPADPAGIEVPCESRWSENRERHLLPGFDLPAQVFVRLTSTRPCCGQPRNGRCSQQLLCWPCFTAWISLPPFACTACGCTLRRSQFVLSATPLERAT